jgi:hypothetical protein
MTATMFIMVLALVLLALATFRVPEPPWATYGWAGLFLWLLVELLGRGKFLA